MKLFQFTNANNKIFIKITEHQYPLIVSNNFDHILLGIFLGTKSFPYYFIKQSKLLNTTF